MNFDIKLVDSNGETPAGESPPGAVDYGRGRKIKDTSSICPVCLEPVAAEVFERRHEVRMDKYCASHGRFSALLSSDIRHCTSSKHMAPLEPFSKRHFSARTFSSLAC